MAGNQSTCQRISLSGTQVVVVVAVVVWVLFFFGCFSLLALYIVALKAWRSERTMAGKKRQHRRKFSSETVAP